MTSTNDVSLRMARSRQARQYSKAQPRPVLTQSDYIARDRTITLPTLKSIYGGKPVTYLDGQLMAGGQVVRTRESPELIEVRS